MEQSKKFLRYALGASMILVSLSIFIFSVKGNTATAQGNDTYTPVGAVERNGYIYVVGYNRSGSCTWLATKKL